MSKYKWFSMLILLIMSLAHVRNGLAQVATPPAPTDDQVNAIAKQLYCPVCENTPLDVCPTQACAEWRELIRDKLSVGWTGEQIIQFFVDQYGYRVLGAPPASGINWFAYIIPPIGFLVGVFVLLRALKSLRASSILAEAKASPSTSTGDKYIDRVEEELRKL
jgi:cytochrome c-type biogenesis protein CcmH